MPLALPDASHLRVEAERYDFHDCRRIPLARMPDAAQLLTAFAEAAPPWVDGLMRWRNRLVAPFGLKTGVLAQVSPPVSLGQQIGLFRLLHLGPHEAVLGENDRHLDFRVSLLAVDGALWCSTLVRTHNIYGRLYLILVKPWHHLIAGTMLRRMAKRLTAAAT